MWNYKMPKLWLARIPAIWDRTIPMDYPKSSSEFSLSFNDEETRNAVLEMEANLGTEETIITEEVLPEGCVVTGYAGTYDVLAESGVETLLSPERVDTENVIAMHYAVTDGAENGEWVQIENVVVKDGYVWGTLTDFSPIAIFTYKKAAHVEASVDPFSGFTKYIVGEGNPIRVYKDEEDKIFVVSAGVKEEIDANDKVLIIGGTLDGSELESTSVAVNGVSIPKVKIITGSVSISNDAVAKLGTAKCTIRNATVGSVTGSYGAVRTENVVYDFDTVTLGFMGCGEGYKQLNTPPTSFASTSWAKNVNMKLINVTDQLTFIGQNCEYFYVHNTYAYVEGGKHDYLIMGGSNEGTNVTRMDVVDSKVGIFQTTNRGHVADAAVTFKGCEVDHLYVGGDASDNTVTGTTGKLKYEVLQCDHGKYTFENGTEAGQLLTHEDVTRIVDVISVYRDTNVTIAPELLNILGAKYIVK